MSQQPSQPGPPVTPPPQSAEFTVSQGFGAAGPKRPGTVTTAGVLAIVFGALSGLGALAMLVAFVLTIIRGSGSLVDLRIVTGLFLFLLAVAGIACGSLLLRGRAIARVGVFLFLGTAALVALSFIVDTIAELLFTSRKVDYNDFTILIPIYLVAFALTATPVILLAAPAASRWFHARRPAPSPGGFGPSSATSGTSPEFGPSGLAAPGSQIPPAVTGPAGSTMPSAVMPGSSDRPPGVTQALV
ncbi:MAG: hypothetical protein ACRD0P_17620, partial [Stackebrandtia sp.]